MKHVLKFAISGWAMIAAMMIAPKPAFADHGEIGVGRNAENKLVPHVDFPQPVLLARSIFPGFPGFATADVGLASAFVDEPDEDLYTLAPSSDIRVILVAVDSGAALHDGFPSVATGSWIDVGAPLFDYHPIWSIEDPQAQPGDTFSFRLKFHDLSGISADSDEFTVTFSPACPADFDTSGETSIDDLFFFLNEWFLGHLTADFNRNRVMEIDDVFLYINAFFTVCP